MKINIPDGIIICYRTEDGIVYEDLNSAKNHQKIIDNATYITQLVHDLGNILKEMKNEKC